MLELATDGRSPSFEYCAIKQQATEATSENCWIFLGLKTNYPTNKQHKNKACSEDHQPIIFSEILIERVFSIFYYAPGGKIPIEVYFPYFPMRVIYRTCELARKTCVSYEVIYVQRIICRPVLRVRSTFKQ